MPRHGGSSHGKSKPQGHKTASKAIKVVKVAQAKREEKVVTKTLRVGMKSPAWEAGRNV